MNGRMHGRTRYGVPVAVFMAGFMVGCKQFPSQLLQLLLKACRDRKAMRHFLAAQVLYCAHGAAEGEDCCSNRRW